MQTPATAALPHVDVFVRGQHLDAMREVIDAIGRTSAREG
jgi:hypothetical protein